VVKEVTIPTSAPIRVSALLKQLCLHLHLTVEPTPSRTMHVGESTMLLGRKPKKLQTLSLVCFLLVTLLQLMLTSTPTHNQISGLINRARVRQLNNQVSSFLASYSSYLDNGNMCSVCCLGMTDRNETKLHSRRRHSDSRTVAACDGCPNHVWTWIQAYKYFLKSSWSLLSYASNLKSISCRSRPQSLF
jgi:hypothetical protein